MIILLCAAAYSRKYWLFLATLALCCLLTGWGQVLVCVVVAFIAASVMLALVIAHFTPPRSVLSALRICSSEGWRGKKVIAASKLRESGEGFPLRPGRWLRVKIDEGEQPALMFALDDSPVSIGDELEILHEIWEQYDEITADEPSEKDRENAERAGAKMIARFGLPSKIPPISVPPAEGELEKDGLHRRPALIFTYLEVAKKTETYYDLPPQHGLR